MKELIKALEDLGYEEVDFYDPSDGYAATVYTPTSKRYFTKKQEKTLDEIYEDWCAKSEIYLDGVKTPHSAIHSKIFAIYKVLAVADYLNGDWKPDWDDYFSSKFIISFGYESNSVDIDEFTSYSNNFAYFKDEETAKKAIDILGEDVIRTAYS